MFIRVKERKPGVKSIQIVESVRDGKKVRQKIVRHIGQAVYEHEIEALKEVAKKTIIHIKNERNPVLPIFEPDAFYGIQKEKKKIPDSVQLNEIQETKRVNDGIGDIFGHLYNQLKLDNLVNGSRKDKQWNSILKSCVLARIANPVSKRKTVKNIALDYAIDIPLEKVYRMMDHVFKREDEIKQHVLNTTLGIFEQKIDVMFFDVTTLYFESFETDDLRNFGFSKDCKFKETQIVLALVTTEEGMPITYRLFPGNMYEGKTLVEMINSLKKDFTVRNILLVADRAMFTQDNLSLMDDKNIKYIVAAKLKKLKKEIKEKITSDDFAPSIVKNELHWLKEYDCQNRRLVVSYSSKRAKKDKSDRDRLVNRLLKKAKDGQVKVKDLISNSGTKKYIRVLKDQASINDEKIKEDSLWDGLHGVITNVNDKSMVEILEKYRGLWKIEEAFRVNKHDLKMRPIFHWKESRIKAHISICYLAYMLVSYINLKLKNKKIHLSFEEIREELLRVESSIVKDTKTKNLYGIPSKKTELQEKIYKAFGLQREDTPYAF